MRLRRGCSGGWIALLAALADRLTKVAAQRLSLGALIPGVINLRPTVNRGIAFSMLSGQGAWLAIMTLALIAAVTGWLVAHPHAPKLLRAGLWLIVGGGLGNLYDRVVYGYVIDFIEPAFVRFAVFNVADAGICVGAALAILSVALTERRGRKRHGA